jgi:hypothetical protein
MVHEKRNEELPAFVGAEEFSVPPAVEEEDVVEYELEMRIGVLHRT